MRVIAGSARGRRLEAPKGAATRPTPDRVREALFSILYGRIENARVLDLFAGTGALGIEALSRGAAHATFVEHDRATAELVRKNVEALGFRARARIMGTTATAAIADLAKESFDLLFLDPPYDAGVLGATLELLAKKGLVADEGLVVCEHRSSDAPPPPPATFALEDTRRYGEVALSFYLRAKGSAP